MADSATTLCPYCGVGCGLEVLNINTDNYKIRGDRKHPSSQGQVCIKGASITESLDKDRLLYPLIRESLSEPLRRATWEEALTLIRDRIQNVLDTQGPDGVCMYGSGQFQTEDYYIAQKLLKGCLGTNNFDANSRLCMSSAVAGYIQSFGSDGPPACYDDLEQTDMAFLIGTNTAECHPIVFNRLRRYHKKNRHVKLVVVDPRRTETAKDADFHLAIKPGTDIDLLNGIAHLLLRWRKLDSLFIDESTQGFDKFVDVIRDYTPEVVSRRCGIRIDDFERVARLWADSPRILSLWSMGVNQSTEGTAKVRSIINLHLMTGTIGRPGCGPFSLTGQPNAMGGREAGGLSHILPGYRVVKNDAQRAQVEKIWGVPAGRISPRPGRDAWSMITGLEQGQVGCLWIAATNPAVSMPDLVRTKAALIKSPFTIYQDAYYPTETTSYAHVVLPAAQWGEKTGIMVNSERVVTYCPAFRQPPGEARADWEIFAEVGRRLGFTQEFDFADAASVYQEFTEFTRDRLCDQTGLSHQRLGAEGPIQWPCSDQDPRTGDENSHGKRLYTDGSFATPDGRAKFGAFHSRGLAEPPDQEFPLVLTVGRLYGHWHTQTRTGRIARIVKIHPEPLLEVHPRDAARIDVIDGEWVIVRSRRGQAKFKIKSTTAISPGTVFAPMHWGALWADEAEPNALMHAEACPISLEPELKACAVQLLPLAQQTTQSVTVQTTHEVKSPAAVK
ncbi:MAG: nitrate reductase [Cyanobacteria bacterium P01_H01_bin.15]